MGLHTKANVREYLMFGLDLIRATVSLSSDPGKAVEK